MIVIVIVNAIVIVIVNAIVIVIVNAMIGGKKREEGDVWECSPFNGADTILVEDMSWRFYVNAIRQVRVKKGHMIVRHIEKALEVCNSYVSLTHSLTHSLAHVFDGAVVCVHCEDHVVNLLWSLMLLCCCAFGS